MIRNLVEKLPLMTTPRWVRQAAQPIAIEDVVAYLVAAVEALATGSRVYEIGGADIVTYGDILRRYAARRGLKRLVIPVPFLTPRLSAGWLYLFTPAQATVGKQLANRCGTRRPPMTPQPGATSPPSRRWESIAPSTGRSRTRTPKLPKRGGATRWGAANSPSRRSGRAARDGSSTSARSVSPARRRRPSARSRASAARRVGTPGTGCGTRGWLDQVTGGVGSSRGRRHPVELRAGDALDFWRVVSIDPPRSLLLQAEMRVPGRGWLRYDVERDAETGGSIVHQTAIFDSKGLFGLVYWHALVPFHALVFNGVLRGVERECARL